MLRESLLLINFGLLLHQKFVKLNIYLPNVIFSSESGGRIKSKIDRKLKTLIFRIARVHIGEQNSNI